jgi:hypothetical protein
MESISFTFLVSLDAVVHRPDFDIWNVQLRGIFFR